jgi:hypothetical protein
MSDYNSSLPARTENAGDIDVFISDATTPTQKLKVNVDGSIDTNFATGSKIIITDGTEDLEINADGSLNAVVTAVDLDVRDLVFATDKVDVSGSTITATDLDIRDLVFATDKVDVSGSTVAVTAVDLDVRDLVFATDKVDVTGSDVTATVTATDLDIRDLVAVTDSVQANLFDEAGNAFSLTNPLAVEMVSDQSGDEVCDFNTSAAVAKDASVNHDYSVTAAKTLLMDSAWISGSGKLKVEVLVNAVPVFVGFNSTANPNIEIPMNKICKANAAEVVRFTITNRDNQAQDLYSTLTGLEV